MASRWQTAGVNHAAGAIRSTAADMLLYVRANLHPETASSADGLRAAIEEQCKLRAEIGPGAADPAVFVLALNRD